MNEVLIKSNEEGTPQLQPSLQYHPATELVHLTSLDSIRTSSIFFLFNFTAHTNMYVCVYAYMYIYMYVYI